MVDTEGRRLLVAFVDAGGLTQAEAARQLGVTRAAFGEWIAGSGRPRPEQREAIERWTSGAVPAVSWITDDERAQIDTIVPFGATGPG